MKIITTDYNNNLFWKEEEVELAKQEDCMHVFNLYPEVGYQTVKGFGGAFTEASAHIYAQMSKEKKAEIIEDYFGESGLKYRLGRIAMNSCDFGLGNYCYLPEGSENLDDFDISHDKREILPLLNDAQDKIGGPLTVLMAPWSPPAFMKTNGDMNHGGKLKPEYRKLWAEYFAKFIEEYEKEGVRINYLTVQNEPLAVQTWDSCVYTGQEEGEFIRDYLGPELQKKYRDIGIFVWDHNKELGYDRMKEVLSVTGADEYVKGEALHWYTGDHFESIEIVRKQYPDKEVFFTEGCVEYSRFNDSGEVDKAEMYAHDILGNLNAGITASFDWNLILDEQGGPNHVGNFCAAPIMCDPGKDTYEKRLSYYYIGHFSRYIMPGAMRIGFTRYTDKLQMTAFRNPDGSKVAVLLNKTEKEVEATVREGEKGCHLFVQPHTIVTICY